LSACLQSFPKLRASYHSNFFNSIYTFLFPRIRAGVFKRGGFRFFRIIRTAKKAGALKRRTSAPVFVSHPYRRIFAARDKGKNS
ncbi:MAG: hypothetical protein KKB25_02885, partial [Nanoarchaeota archaeon]|nr:hypothetical protein [Nanoarchaeota archaeon]